MITKCTSVLALVLLSATGCDGKVQGIFMNGGSCQASHILTPAVNGGSEAMVIETGLKQYYHSAAASYDGHVYIFGGATKINGYGATQDMQIYDPQTNTTMMGAPMNFKRTMHTATVFGQYILVCGGMDHTFTVVATCEAYDVANNSWALFGQNMSTPVHSHGAAVLNEPGDVAIDSHRIMDNFFYIFGGFDASEKATDLVYKGKYFAGGMDYMNPMGKMTMPRADFGFATVANRLLACGGWEKEPQTIITSCEFMDPITQKFSPYNALVKPRQYQVMVSWMYPEFSPFSNVFVIGGYNKFLKNPDDSVEKYTVFGSQMSNLKIAAPCAAMIAVPINDGSPCKDANTQSLKQAPVGMDMW